jgi:4-amino-4-deoxy-L-arabinose transferase-like glycosyltransferase
MKISKATVSIVSVFLLLAVLSYIPLFYKLGSHAINEWDEAFYAINSVETTLNNNFIVLTENDSVSTYNTKPPLVIWLQSAFMRMFGINELSVRLPSALAAFVIMTALYFFSIKVFNSKIMGISAALVFLTSDGFIAPHVSRTGDLDAMVSMWIVLYTLTFITFLLTKEKIRNRSYYLIAFLVIMAFLSKSIAGFLPLPGLAICALLSEKRNEIFRNRHLYFSSAIVILFCVAFYVIRESLAGGFIQMVWDSEIMRFSQDITPWHAHPVYFYVETLAKIFLPYLYIMPAAIFIGLINPDKKIKSATLYLTVCSFSYLLLISYPTDKFINYLAPLYPLFSLLIGILFYSAYRYFKKFVSSKKFIPEIIFFVLMTALFYQPYIHIYNKVEEFSRHYVDYYAESHFAKKINSKEKHFNYKVFYKPSMVINEFQLNFYRKAYAYNEGMHIDVCDTISQIKINDTIMVCQGDKKDALNKYYSTEIIDQCDNCLLVVVKTKKSDSGNAIK